MNIHQEEKYPNWIALISAFVFLGIIVLIFILIKIITPIPPFPESASSEGMEVNYGTYNPGTGNIEENHIGEATDVIVKETSTSNNANNKNEPTYTSENGEPAEPMQNDKNDKNDKTSPTIIQPTEVKQKPKEKTAAELLSEKFNKNKGKGGGDGNSGYEGNEGEPEGNPLSNGKGGTGNNPDGIGRGTGNGKAPFGFDLKGRSLMYHPPLPSDTKEEGIVVVDIKVDSQGNVTEADPNGRGTTTTSPILKAKARQFALQIKFSSNNQFQEQKGSITIVFSFK